MDHYKKPEAIKQGAAGRTEKRPLLMLQAAATLTKKKRAWKYIFPDHIETISKRIIKAFNV